MKTQQEIIHENLTHRIQRGPWVQYKNSPKSCGAVIHWIYALSENYNMAETISVGDGKISYREYKDCITFKWTEDNRPHFTIHLTGDSSMDSILKNLKNNQRTLFGAREACIFSEGWASGYDDEPYHNPYPENSAENEWWENGYAQGSRDC